MQLELGQSFFGTVIRLFLPDTKLQARARLRGGASFSRLYRTTPEGERRHTATRYASRKSQDRERARSQLMTIGCADWLSALEGALGFPLFQTRFPLSGGVNCGLDLSFLSNDFSLEVRLPPWLFPPRRSFLKNFQSRFRAGNFSIARSQPAKKYAL